MYMLISSRNTCMHIPRITFNHIPGHPRAKSSRYIKLTTILYDSDYMTFWKWHNYRHFRVVMGSEGERDELVEYRIFLGQ